MSPGIRGIQIDTAEWPVVRVLVGPGVDEPVTRAFIASFLQIIGRDQPFVLVFDHTETELLPLPAIFAARELMPTLLPGLKAHCRAICSFTPNPVVRAIVRGVLQVITFPVPPTVVGTREELDAWILAQRKRFF